jgi:hypothetical protein
VPASVGMLGGILASRHGLTALVVERRDGPQTSPAAHEVNARTYEICRQAGLDMPIHAAGKDPADSGHVNFVTRLTGQLIGHLPFGRQGEACLQFTPTPPRNLSQHRFEPILADELRSCPGSSCASGSSGYASRRSMAPSSPPSPTAPLMRPRSPSTTTTTDGATRSSTERQASHSTPRSSGGERGG